MIGPAPICLLCKHFHQGAPALTCAAYPDGIPEAILTNQVDHRQPVEGDHGIRFEAVADRPGQVAQVIAFAFPGPTPAPASQIST
jgi:hypothetical protein